jgi:hypothetical protein
MKTSFSAFLREQTLMNTTAASYREMGSAKVPNAKSETEGKYRVFQKFIPGVNGTTITFYIYQHSSSKNY